MMLQGSSNSILQQQHKAAKQQRPVLLAPRRTCSSRVVRVAATATAPAPAPAATADLTKQIVADEAQYVLQTYARPADIVFVKGEGSKLYDANGKEYLDMAAGAACRTFLVLSTRDAVFMTWQCLHKCSCDLACACFLRLSWKSLWTMQ
jgi:hypothetical protein